MTRRLVVAALALVAAAGCGKSEEEKAAEQTAKAAEQMAKSAEQMAQSAQQGAQQMAQGMQQMAQGLQQAQGNVTVVDFEKLEALLPQMSGWTRGETEGEQQAAMGFKTSRAEAEYTSGDSRMTLEIQDIALAQMMLSGFTMYMASGFEERSSDGYKRATKIAGYPGFEEWQKGSRHAEVTAVVNNRFIVVARANDVPSTEPARKLIEAVDLGKLASLK
jgi:glucose/arabinose dehydrogenase